jgi:prophage regulatory protein
MSCPQTLLTISEVAQRTRLSKPTIYRLVAAGAFPVQLHLGPHRVAWLEDEVVKWITSRAAARNLVLAA